jgi:hypothetical protein
MLLFLRKLLRAAPLKIGTASGFTASSVLTRAGEPGAFAK